MTQTIKKRTVSVTPAKIFVVALGVGAIGTGIYFANEYFAKPKEENGSGNNDSQLPSAINTPAITAPTTQSSGILNWFSGRNDSFPLKRGSLGQKVTDMQEGLKKILGDRMKQYTGVDGQFGPGTEKALLAAGYGSSIDESTFNQITGGNSGSGSGSGMDTSTMASNLHSSASDKDINGVMNVLKMMRNVSDYSAVDAIYKNLGFIHKTIVTDLLDIAFPYDESARMKIKPEFLRMGLKLDSATGRWSLSGLGGFNDIITLFDTVVMDSKNNRIPVRKNTILGDEVKSSAGLTCFRALDGSLGLVHTSHIKSV